MENKMFCCQCQEAAGGIGCTRMGVCGKKPEVAAMQDLLIYVTKGLSCVTTALRNEGVSIDKEVNHRITQNLFVTITNANFDREAVIGRIKETLLVKERLLGQTADPSALPEAARWNGAEDEFEAKAESASVGVLSAENEDVRSLRELITYGLKGLAAYSEHANALLKDSEDVDAFPQSALAKLLDDGLGIEQADAPPPPNWRPAVSSAALPMRRSLPWRTVWRTR